MSKITTIKGFADHLPAEAKRFNHLSSVAKDVFSSYGYKEVHVPILEYTDLFSRSIGTETDVVQKEMFTFPDRKGRLLTMRPEATAGIMRSYIEHSMHTKESISKLFTFGPMFRYERPQKGRMRQFHQLNCEMLGAVEPQADAETILMLMSFLEKVGLTELVLEINNLGCQECRPAFKETLKEFFAAQNKEEYCEDCQRRMETSPLRVLDCKQPRCKELSEQAPKIAENVCPSCKEHFAAVLESLQQNDLSYKLNHRLVRGLDYYSRTTFEVVSGAIGAQSSVAGGGRYDGLIASLGGPDIPGIGFACGMERLNLLMPELPEDGTDFYVAVLDQNGLSAGLKLAQKLRANGLNGNCTFAASSAKSQLRQASRHKARYCLIIGSTELENGTVVVKNMESGEQREEKRDTLTLE